MWHTFISTGLDKEQIINAKLTVSGDSPWFAGHFPDDPTLPGIAQLNMITETIAKVLQKKLTLQSVTRIKFKKIIRPRDILDICATTGKKKNQYAFTITSKNQDVCSGSLILVPIKEQQSTDGN